MNSIYTALLGFQGSVRAIPKNRQGYGYKFADLDLIWEAIRPLLQQHGLAIWQGVEDKDGRAAVRTILVHPETGGTLESVAVEPVWPVEPTEADDGKKKKGFASPVQRMGASVTYLRRYAIISALGLTTDEDADGTWIDQNSADMEGQRIAQATENAVARAKLLKSKDEFSRLKTELLGTWGFMSGGKRVLPSAMSEALAAEYAAFEERGCKPEGGE